MLSVFFATRNTLSVRHRSAFTLIELLVVIAIIAILAAILFPVFAQARDKARAAACLSNEKQIGIGIIMYSQDYDDTLPIAYYGATGLEGAVATVPKYMDLVFPYVKSEAVFTCPSRTSDYNDNYNYQHYTRRTGRNYGTYFINSAYSSSSLVPSTPVSGAPLAAIKDSAGTVFVLEAPWTYSKTSSNGLNTAARTAEITFDVTSGNPSWVNTTSNPVEVSANGQQRFIAPHGGRANTIFCDGHAKSYDPRELMSTHALNGKTVTYLFTPEAD
jgi:prepilin-type N-terminal cleavage/methylation domain-containing protein/prepilin-type processing-associated H-X9-DG protein